MKNSTLCVLVTGLFLFSGCANMMAQKYEPYSEGLPSGQQWKCNPDFGDVNNDGLLDLTAIPRKWGGPFVWINQGDGTWTDSSEGLLRKGTCGGGVDFGDVNNDGNLDLAVGDHCKGLFVYKGDGQGKWAMSSDGLKESYADDIALTDLNLDGNLDLIACSSNMEGIGIYFGDGDGNWEESTSSGLPSSGACHELSVDDLNNDGVPDIAATMISQLRVWVSTEKGQWEESSSGLPKPKWGGQFWGVTSGDVNEDGNADLVVGRIVTGPEVYFGDGKGNWQPGPNEPSGVESAWGVALGDTNGDSHLDLIVSGKKVLKAHGMASGVFLLEGDGQGNWELIKHSGLPAEGISQSWGLAVADLDNDSIPEIGGCFGKGSVKPFPFAAEVARKQGVEYLGGSGPKGSVRVWKLK